MKRREGINKMKRQKNTSFYNKTKGLLEQKRRSDSLRYTLIFVVVSKLYISHHHDDHAIRRKELICFWYKNRITLRGEAANEKEERWISHYDYIWGIHVFRAKPFFRIRSSDTRGQLVERTTPSSSSPTRGWLFTWLQFTPSQSFIVW